MRLLLLLVLWAVNPGHPDLASCVAVARFLGVHNCTPQMSDMTLRSTGQCEYPSCIMLSLSFLLLLPLLGVLPGTLVVETTMFANVKGFVE